MPIFKKALLTLTLMLTFLGGMFVSFVPHPEKGQMQMSITSASAQESTPKADTAKTDASAAQNDEIKTIKEAYEKLVELINIVLGVVTILVSPIVLLAGWLMSPDWTSGDLFRLREPMYQLWITISNIVYFLYAILLIIIALATIFNSQNYGYKALLPRLFLGILLVPFTWWAVQWMISIASVVTASVVTIPYETIEALNAKSENKNNIWWENPSIPRDIDSKTLFTSIESIKIDCSKEGSNCIAPKKFTEDAAGMYGSLVIYAYSVFRIQDVKMINTKFDAAKGLVDIVTNGIISAVMFILFGLLTIALVVILFVRAFKLWIYAIFSPLFTFKFVLGKS